MTSPNHPWQDPSATPEDRAASLLAAMTLQEKVGQLGSYWPRPEQEPGAGDVAPMQEAFDQNRRPFAETIRHGLGHLTRQFGSAPVEPEEGIRLLHEAQQQVAAASRFGIPAIAHEECLTGFTTYRATVYPTAIAWGATFNPGLIHRMAAAIGHDMRSVGVHQGLSPLLDVVRDYRWGRVEEAIGEDPYLVGTLGTAYVQGLQSEGVLATLKHFAGYPASKGGRNHAPVAIGPREFTDVILTPFEMAVREGNVASVMNSYSDIDGLPAAASHELLTTVLRGQWGFTGTVVSDYWAIAFLDLMHRVTATRQQSGATALRSGIDVELPETDAFARLDELVHAGELDEAYIDRACLRVLTQKASLGLLDEDWAPLPAPSGGTIDLDSDTNRAVARQIAEESIILLANNGTLPLAPTSRIALLGPCAAEPRTFLGCYSFPNHVLARYEDGTGVHVPSLMEGLRAALPGTAIEHHLGVPILNADASGIDAAVDAAARAELAVLAVGDLAALFGRGTSGEGCDAEDLKLPGLQHDLVEAVLATGTPVVLVVVSGRPYALGAYANRCAAIVQAFMPGEEGAAAIADVLTGTVNPSGHLPVGIPRTPGGQPFTYLAPVLGRHSDGISNLDPSPLFPFGHGLSYTRFEYADLRVTTEELPTDGSLTLTVRVTNTGNHAGDDVVQLYLADHIGQVTRPVRSLIGYQRVCLAPGESVDVTFDVHADRTVFTGRDLKRVVEPGAISLSIGHSSENLPLTAHVDLVGPERIVDAPVLTTPAIVTAIHLTGATP